MIERIKSIRRKEIVLVVPRKAILFQSVVNLKILKAKMDAKGKTLILVTTDRNGKHLAEKIGLKVMKRIEVEKTEAQSDETPQMKIQPIQARRNESREERPQRFFEKKRTIRELLEEYRKKDPKKSETDALAHYLGKPSRKFLILIVMASAGLFGLITYIALPSATIYIRPKFDHLDHTINITLADKRLNQTLLQENRPHVIAGERVKTTTKQTKIFTTSSQEFDGENATGLIDVINTTDEEWELTEGTRFQSEQGIIFRTVLDIFVPPRIKDDEGGVSPGKLSVKVVADPFDAYAKPVGDRGNLGPGRFTIPGLSKYNQRLIWGESRESMTGGITSYRHIVNETDIDAAKNQIEDNLIVMAKEDLRTHIDELNHLNQTKLVLLDDSRYLKTKLVELRISDDLEGSYKEKFELFAKIEAEGFAFDHDQLFSVLKKELNNRTHPEMKLREDSIESENIVYEVIDEDEHLGQVKITATIEGIEEFAIDSSTDAGIQFGQQLKDKVTGLSLEEAEKLVGNLEEVDAVEIKAWPIWIKKIPRIPESVEVKLMKSS